jgi:hypothetical protein
MHTHANSDNHLKILALLGSTVQFSRQIKARCGDADDVPLALADTSSSDLARMTEPHCQCSARARSHAVPMSASFAFSRAGPYRSHYTEIVTVYGTARASFLLDLHWIGRATIDAKHYRRLAGTIRIGKLRVTPNVG